MSKAAMDVPLIDWVGVFRLVRRRGDFGGPRCVLLLFAALALVFCLALFVELTLTFLKRCWILCHLLPMRLFCEHGMEVGSQRWRCSISVLRICVRTCTFAA